MNLEFNKWLAYAKLDAVLKQELETIKNSPAEIEARFSLPMHFGTAGLRSFMGAGIGRMNIYTVAQTTQGLAQLINQSEGKKSVVIAYDSRNNSRLFAETSAGVLAANDIQVFMFESLRPTPELSFAVLHLGAMAGINITASHNPKEYNGYKVFWSDGAQLSVEHAAVVSETVCTLDIFADIKQIEFKAGVESGKITLIGAEIDELFLQAVLDCRINPEIIASHAGDLNMIFTPFHGAGGYLIPETLTRAGVTNLRVVPEQSEPDGNFPTVKSPNPENKEGFALAINMAFNTECDAELIIGSDPDADRIGVVVKDSDGLYTSLTGNQVGLLLVDYIITARGIKGLLPDNAAAIRSVVSSRLFDEICKAHNVAPFTVLTGFKYVGEKINEFLESGSHEFIFAYEESCGYLPGAYIRDKDAVGATLLFVELAAYYKSLGKSVFGRLAEIYQKYGYYDELTQNIMIGGNDPMSEMKARMKRLRERPRADIFGTSVLKIKDYSTSTVLDLVTGESEDVALPQTDMLIYELEDTTEIAIRPSGTEPKVKAYILAKGRSPDDVAAKLESYKNFTI